MTVHSGTYFAAHECSGGAERGTQVLQAYLLSRFPKFTNGGIFNCRNIAGSDKLSVHGTGRAFDTMTGTGSPTLESLFVAEQMRLFSRELGLQGIIHHRKQWFCHKGDAWRDYNGSNPHEDHIHGERTGYVNASLATVQDVFEGDSINGPGLFAGHIVSYTSRGNHVSYVQSRLNAHGFLLKVDGQCGPKTVDAIRRFQQLAGLKVDGVAGPKTQGRLR